jgi:hypothetical protein
VASIKELLKKVRAKGIPLTSSEEADAPRKALPFVPDVLEEPIAPVPRRSEEWWEDEYAGIDRTKPQEPTPEPTDPEERERYRRYMKQRGDVIKRDRELRDQQLRQRIEEKKKSPRSHVMGVRG